MNQFIADKKELTGKLILEGMIGKLTIFTLIKILGNYRNGPVNVNVSYEFQFRPNDEYFEINKEDNELNSYTISKSFSEELERDNYLKNFFKIDG